MGNANYIGRVGALAVALGIGTAVATTPWVAVAEPPADSSSAADPSSSPSETKSTSTGDTKPAPSVDTSGGAHPAADTADIAEPADEEPGAETDEETSATPETPEPTAEEPADAEPATGPESGAPEQPLVSKIPATEAVALNKPSDNDGPAPAQPVTVDLPATDTDIADLNAGVPAVRRLGAVHQPAGTVPVASAPRNAATASAVPSAEAGPPTAVAAQLLPAAPVNPIGLVSDVVTRVVSGLLAWVGLGPGLTNAPAAPVQPPLLWGLLEWARRQIQHMFFNQAPTISYNPVLNSQTLDGVVTGDLRAVDPDGDPVTLSVVEAPEYGTVVINRDGTFTYTPDPEFARTGGTDEFTVMAASTGFHLFGPGGVFAPGFGYTTLAKASVQLVAIKTTIDVGDAPVGVAVSPDGTRAYVVHRDFSGTVSVIDTGTNTVIDTITVGAGPNDLNSVAVTADGAFAYVTNFYDDTVVGHRHRHQHRHRHHHRRRQSPRGGDQTRRHPRLRHQLRRRHRVGDRHRHQRRHRHHHRRQRADGGGGQSRRRQRLCHQRRQPGGR